MPESVFISRTWADRDHVNQIRQWALDRLLGDVVITEETRDRRQDGDPGIRAHLNSRLEGAAAVVVLVGDLAHDRRWVNHEVAYALSRGTPVCVMRIPGTTGAAPGDVRSRRELGFRAVELRGWLGT